MDFATLQSDPEFMALPFTEKVKAMAAIDPTFARLKPDEQHLGLSVLFPPQPNEQANENKNFPKPNALGAQVADAGLSGGDVAGAAGKGLAHLAGIPTSIEQVPGAAKDLLLNALTVGQYGAVKAAGGMIGDIAQGRPPIIGKPLDDLGAPARATMAGRAPTRAENLGAIEGGTSLAGMAAMQHPALAGAMERVMPQAGAALEEAGTGQYADALAPRGSAQRPLAETLGSQLAGKGKVLADPKSQLADQFGGYQTAGDSIKKFAKSGAADNQLAALQEKYPKAQIVDDGQGSFLIRDRSPEQVGADSLADAMPAKEGGGALKAAGALAKTAAGGLVGGGLGFMVGGPAGAVMGAKIGGEAVGAAEGMQAMKSLIQSPLWKTTAGSIKTMAGKAMQSQDFATVTNIAARVLGGENLDDVYGHDKALHGLMQTIGDAPPPQLNQALQDYDAVYVDPSGTAIQVPHHVLKGTFDAVTSH